MKMTGGQIICESLVREGVEVIFGILGGAVLPLYDTLPQYPQLRHILMRHEQGHFSLTEDTDETVQLAALHWSAREGVQAVKEEEALQLLH